MTTIRKEKIEKSFYDIYVANDGTEFRDKEECRKYEESAYAVMASKYKKLITRTTDEYTFFSYAGSEDTDVEVVKLNTQEEADIMKQMYLIVNPHLKNEDCKARLDGCFKTIDKALESNDVLLVGRASYDRNCSMWLYGTLTDVYEKMKGYTHPEKNDDNA